MKHTRGPRTTAGYAAVGLAFLGLMAGNAQAASGQALVIGEASYASLPPLPGCALSAHAVAAALRGLGFTVDEQVDGSSGALYAAIGTLTKQLAATPHTPAFVYFCGYATSFEDRPFVLPISAAVSRPTDALTQGLLAKTLLNAALGDKTAASVMALDTVRMPDDPSALPLDSLLKPPFPPTLGFIAATTAAPGNTPTPFASTLVPLLRGATTESAKLLADLQLRMAGITTARVVASRVPAAGLDLTGAPPALPRSAIAAAAPPPAASTSQQPSPTAPSAARSLPDENGMTEDQRRLVQRALAHLGYYDANTDGVFGPETRAAIRRWQHEIHVPMTGHLNAGEATRLATSWD